MQLTYILTKAQASDTFKSSGNSPVSSCFNEVGTAKDNAMLPVYRWFAYPTEFSNKLIDTAITYFDIKPGQMLLDPFAGTATSLIAAKLRGIDSIGIEAHFFLHWVASTKLYWDFDLDELHLQIEHIGQEIHKLTQVSGSADLNGLPELVRKCFSNKSLGQLYNLREYVKHNFQDPYSSFFNLALSDTLRLCTNVSVGWPYVSPKKQKKREADVPFTFMKRLELMYEDLLVVKQASLLGKARVILGDARDFGRANMLNAPDEYIPDASVDLVISSPPYLNNYDYADRTRLETYFFGFASRWKDITSQVRDKLIMSATTQVKKDSLTPIDILDQRLKEGVTPEIYNQLIQAVDCLSKLRLTRSGKKKYDYMVAGYFDDMFQVLKELYRVLKRSSACVLILGDSAPYGVHIPTDTILGEIAIRVGFKGYRTVKLRDRGNKWRNLSQRHCIPLHESMVIITKEF